MPKGKLVWIALLLISCSQIAYSQTYKTALGVRFSSAHAVQNNSISFKQFVTDKSAVEVLFSFGDPVAIGALVHKHKSLLPAGLSWYYGGGAFICFVKTFNPQTQKNQTEFRIGGQGVVGLDYKFSQIPLNLSLDWKPELHFFSDISFEPSVVGLTLRFTFR
ncbi:MAG: hypothetical protein N2747_08000 [Chitinophagaceae bacterium]|nr:hypothetical protein [Chitinophagaceae bacterium]